VVASDYRAINSSCRLYELGMLTPRLAGLSLSRMVEQGKMKLTTRRGMASKISCWLGLRSYGSYRSTGNVEEPIGSVILSGELCSCVEFLCVDSCDLLATSQKIVY
jgi:hypothetical protein